MIDTVTDPHPDDEAMRRLWRKAWGDDGHTTFQKILDRSLAHIGAYDGTVLVGFVNVAWDGGIHAFILDTCVDLDYRRRGIAVRLVQRAAEVAHERGTEWLHVDYKPTCRNFIGNAGSGLQMQDEFNWVDPHEPVLTSQSSPQTFCKCSGSTPSDRWYFRMVFRDKPVL
jgi:GNAT superfamily N-acetyltransferase